MRPALAKKASLKPGDNKESPVCNECTNLILLMVRVPKDDIGVIKTNIYYINYL